MILSTHALTTPATAAHTFYALNLHTGIKYTCTLTRETKCYYVVLVDSNCAGYGAIERRFHKATMCINELCLYIRNTDNVTPSAQTATALVEADAVEAAQVALDVLTDEVEAVAVVNAVNMTGSITARLVHTTENFYIVNVALCGKRATQCGFSKRTMQHKALSLTITDGVATVRQVRNPDGNPCFCPQCETYNPFDEMTTSAWVTARICIDCATKEEDALRATLSNIDCTVTVDMKPAKSILVNNQHDGAQYTGELLKETATEYTVLILSASFGDAVRVFPRDTLKNAHFALDVRGDVDTVCHVIDTESLHQFRAVLFSETPRFYTVDVFNYDGVPTRHHFSKMRMMSRDLKLAISGV
jgi:hypothetical protein